jgi:hypothetical protein
MITNNDQFFNAMEPAQKALAVKTLTQLVSFNGDILSAKELIERSAANGSLGVSTHEEDVIKDKSRRGDFGASNEMQTEHRKKQASAGTKTVYLIAVSGLFYELGKTAYSYANFLLNQGGK